VPATTADSRASCDRPRSFFSIDWGYACAGFAYEEPQQASTLTA